MVLSAVHTLSTRENLRQAHERQQEKALWEEEYGSCRLCEDDSLNLPSCKECINGGGKKKLFRSKTRKRRAAWIATTIHQETLEGSGARQGKGGQHGNRRQSE